MTKIGALTVENCVTLHNGKSVNVGEKNDKYIYPLSNLELSVAYNLKDVIINYY